MQDYYAELQVSPKAEPGVIAAAYRYLARMYHPDVTGVVDDERMRRLNAAYEVLADPARRKAYDESRRPVRADELSLMADPVAAHRYGTHRPWFHVAAIVVVSLLAAAGIVLITGQRPGGSAQATVSASASRRPATVARPVAARPPASPTPQAAARRRVDDEPAPAASAEHLPAAPVHGAAVHAGPIATQRAAEPAVDMPLEAIRPLLVTPTPIAASIPAPPFASTAVPTPASTPTPLQYMVQPGDYLGSIALTFGVTAEAIAAANALSNPDTIRVGDLLHIPPSR